MAGEVNIIKIAPAAGQDNKPSSQTTDTADNILPTIESAIRQIRKDSPNFKGSDEYLWQIATIRDKKLIDKYPVSTDKEYIDDARERTKRKEKAEIISDGGTKEMLEATERHLDSMSDKDLISRYNEILQDEKAQVEKAKEIEKKIPMKIARGLGQIVTLGNFVPKHSEMFEKNFSSDRVAYHGAGKDAAKSLIWGGAAGLSIGTGALAAPLKAAPLATKIGVPVGIRALGMGTAQYAGSRLSGKGRGEALSNALLTGGLSAGTDLALHGIGHLAGKYVFNKPNAARTGKWLTEGSIKDPYMYENAVNRGFGLKDGTRMASTTKAGLADVSRKAMPAVKANQNLQVAKMNTAARQLNNVRRMTNKSSAGITKKINEEITRKVISGDMSAAQQKAIKPLIEEIKKGVTDRRLYEIKQFLQANNQSSLARPINDYLRPKYPAYALTSDASSEALRFGKNIVKSAQDPMKVESVIKGYTKSGPVKQQAMERFLEGNLPQGAKFLDDAKAYALNDAFRKLGKPTWRGLGILDSPQLHKGIISTAHTLHPAGDFLRRNQFYTRYMIPAGVSGTVSQRKTIKDLMR